VERMSFAAAQVTFLEAARNGIAARLHWPGVGEVTARELVLDTLLPIAHEGLRRWVLTPRRATGSWTSLRAAPGRAATARAGRCPPWVG
jgi:hypothetical protein